MRRLACRTGAICAVLATAVLYPWASLLAETGVHQDTNRPPTTLLMTTSEGPDPVDSKIWKQFANTGNMSLLNSDGWARGDGPPSVAWYPSSGWPVVVWAYRSGNQHDIAFSEWNGQSWTPVHFISDLPADEIDPRVFIDDDGAIHIVWWVPGPKNRVYYSSRSTIAIGWSAAQEITGPTESGSRPAVAFTDGTLHVVFERPTIIGAAAQEVIVKSSGSQSTGNTTIVAATPRADRLDAIVHVGNGKTWVEWKDGIDEFAWSVLENGGWGPIDKQDWVDPSWIGAEETRALIRRLVFGVPPAPPVTP